ncbi:MAG: VOC family protein [Pseudomonadota bacterium]
MANKHGDFVWYELATSDVDKAKEFYGPLMGWAFEVSGQPEMPYHVFSKDGVQVGGMLSLTTDMIASGAQPLWAGYVEVEDVDASLVKGKEAGANVYVEATEMPEVGKFAMIADPQGAPIYLMSSASEEDSASFAKHEPHDGHCAWNELVTTDPAGAKAFYTDLFGWEKTEEMDMGPMGLYEMYSANGYGVGAIMQKPEMMPMSAWVYYLRVPDIQVAADFANANGGQLMGEPTQIPGGDYVIQGTDPQGAFFALIGKGEASTDG